MNSKDDFEKYFSYFMYEKLFSLIKFPEISPLRKQLSQTKRLQVKIYSKMFFA